MWGRCSELAHLLIFYDKVNLSFNKLLFLSNNYQKEHESRKQYNVFFSFGELQHTILVTIEGTVSVNSI